MIRLFLCPYLGQKSLQKQMSLDWQYYNMNSVNTSLTKAGPDWVEKVFMYYIWFTIYTARVLQIPLVVGLLELALSLYWHCINAHPHTFDRDHPNFMGNCWIKSKTKNSWETVESKVKQRTAQLFGFNFKSLCSDSFFAVLAFEQFKSRDPKQWRYRVSPDIRPVAHSVSMEQSSSTQA